MKNEWSALSTTAYFESYFANKIDSEIAPTLSTPVDRLVGRMLSHDYFWAGWINTNPIALFRCVEIEGADISLFEKQIKVSYQSGLMDGPFKQNHSQRMLGLQEIALFEQEQLFNLLLKENTDALERNINVSISSYLDVENKSRVFVFNVKLKDSCPPPGLENALVTPGLNNKDPLRATHQFITNMNKQAAFQITAISSSIGFNSFKHLFECNLIEALLAPPIATLNNIEQMREAVCLLSQKRNFKHMLPLYQRRGVSVEPVSTSLSEIEIQRKRVIDIDNQSWDDMVRKMFKKPKNL